MKAKYTLLFGFGWIVTLLTVSCESDTKPALATSPVELMTSTVVSQLSLELTTSSPLPTTTPVVNVENTPDLVLSPTASATVAPGTATTTIVVATPAPLPTLEGEELELAVAELLANPMNCDMPCWWGAIPGVTSLYEIRHAISPYNFHISEYEEEGDVVYLLVETGYVQEQGDYEIGVVYNFSHSTLVGLTAYSPPISEILVKYNQPDEVWFSAFNDPREEHPTVWLNIVYLHIGMAANYVVDRVLQNDMAVGCFTDEATGRLRLITPNRATNYEDFSPLFSEDRHYTPLEEATSLTVEDFIQRFTDPTQPHCIETPAELWE
jgi:hypothetical protein